MLKSEPSFASLLVKQSPGMHYGHGWIAGKDGKRWHPSHSQADLLASLLKSGGDHGYRSCFRDCSAKSG